VPPQYTPPVYTPPVVPTPPYQPPYQPPIQPDPPASPGPFGPNQPPVQPQPGTGPTVQPPSASGIQATAQELEMLQLLINDRAQACGPNSIRWDNTVAAVARGHSQRIAVRGEGLSHNDEYGDPFTRLRRASIGNRKAGENIAEHPTAAGAEQMLLADPPHAQIMLDCGYTTVGIGAWVGPRGRVVWTQDFVGR
jgi:uncharacterized protein YkwD